MKSLKECIEANMATPANTNGMGNPAFPEGDNVGSDLITTIKKIKKKRANKSTQIK